MKMPALFVGHGSPMIAIEDNEITRKFTDVGNSILKKYGKPKAILMFSAHWFTKGNFIQSIDSPRQIYDMYGFPKELYDVRYEVVGNKALTSRVIELLGEDIEINDEWGLDHGAWTVLKHMFPKADIPIVQLSINRDYSESEVFDLGEKLSVLKEEGYLIIGSGNIVHNLAKVEWDNEFGSEKAKAFDKLVKDRILNGRYIDILDRLKGDINYSYAVPTKDHFYPLLYVLGVSVGDKVSVFNDVRNLGSISMTSYLFED